MYLKARPSARPFPVLATETSKTSQASCLHWELSLAWLHLALLPGLG